MYKSLLLSLILCIAVRSITAQQAIERFVKDRTVRVNSIQPTDTSYEDLEPIRNAIGNARIVMLGEQDHGDAPTFLAKSRLVRFLHEKMGFNVLAFESDFYALTAGWERADRNPDSLSIFFRKNIFPIWTGCDACHDLFYEYLPATQKTATPLNITGFDCQTILGYSQQTLVATLDSLLKKEDIPLVHQPEYEEAHAFLDSISRWYGRKDVAAENYRQCLQYLEQIKKELQERSFQNKYWYQIIENLQQEVNAFAIYHQDSRSGITIRDRQMADNMAWLSASKFKNEKIIVWAANFHVAKYADSSNGYRLESMGSFFTQDTLRKKETYVMGFTSRNGLAGRLGWNKYKVQKPKGFEKWINPGFDYAFTDFTSLENRNQVFPLKAFEHKNFSQKWARNFDGVFYIKEMYPCDSL